MDPVGVVVAQEQAQALQGGRMEAAVRPVGALEALARRAVLQMQAGLAILTPETLDEAALATARAQAESLSEIIVAAYFQ